MEALSSFATILSSSSSPPSIFSPVRPDSSRLVRFTLSSKKEGNDFDLPSDPKDSSIVPLFGNHTLSKDAAMGLVLSAVSVRGWTTGSGMEGPSIPAGAEDGSGTERISTFPWSLFTKSPRRRMRVAFTCNCYVNPSFNYQAPKWDEVGFKYLDTEDDRDDGFPK
ncbi:hypothetical protein F2P56_018199 [Juglans regia]|uniref:Uncharacterized protein n=1 Tax=Juglans regia TaxID=51240 RepID=A0A833UIE5_JUGRE|nr:hypothetical protein F2P56_018199 [Juglans regia]